MQYIFQGLYLVSICLHLTAMVIGLVTMAKHGELFRECKPGSILTCNVEQKYWTLALSTICNGIILMALPQYITNNIGFMPAKQEVQFALYHVMNGSVMVLWHTIMLVKLNAIHIDRGRNCSSGYYNK